MFTGIIEEVGEIRTRHQRGEGAELEILTSLAAQMRTGESVAVDGCCLTVARSDNTLFSAQLSPETLQRTTFGERQPGERVNLERALTVGDRLGGHIVQGHIDTKGVVLGIEEGREYWTYSFSVDPCFRAYLVQKGSIAVDGISLTIAALSRQGFEAAIIPYTHDHTTLQYRLVGEMLNLEFDILSKYVCRYLEERTQLEDRIS